MKLKRNKTLRLTGQKDVFTLAVGALPNPVTHRKEARAVADFLNALPGFVSLTPTVAPDGSVATILAFETYNDAKTARNMLRVEGNKTGNYIMTAKIDFDAGALKVNGVAEGEMPS